MSSGTGILAPWGAEVVLITWRSVRQENRPPIPSEYLASFIVFGGLALIAPSQPQIAGLLGWGIVLATALNFFPLTPKGTMFRTQPVGEAGGFAAGGGGGSVAPHVL